MDNSANDRSDFPRSCRLGTKSEFNQVFRSNRRYTDRNWTILVCRSSSSNSKLGLAIAKKRAKRAVDRNRIKRIAREAFRHQQSGLNGYHLVIMNRDAAARVCSRELRQSLDNLLNKIKHSNTST
ncbi:MAG: ribonuclease P protein component [Granulosicoccus sp.]|nr:ribonuclease P protein component [Granulosicoccus sp.]